MKVFVRDDLKVVLDDLPRRRDFVLDADQAVHFAMAVAEAAAKCGFRDAQTSVIRHVEQQMRGKVTDEIRAAMIARAAHVLPQLIEHKLTPAHAAAQIVDIVLGAAQGRVVN